MRFNGGIAAVVLSFYQMFASNRNSARELYQQWKESKVHNGQLTKSESAQCTCYKADWLIIFVLIVARMSAEHITLQRSNNKLASLSAHNKANF